MSKSLKSQMLTVIKRQERAISDRKTGYEGLNPELQRYGRITSLVSAEGHEARAKKLAAWLMEKYKIKKIGDLTPEHFKKYISYKISSGLSAKTIESEILTINHILVPLGISEPLSKVQDFGIVYRSGDVKNNRKLSIENWIQTHLQSYQKNIKIVDTARAFGLRRSEILGSKISGRVSKIGLTTRSFFRNETGRLCVVAVAKGGHLYMSECRQDMSLEMEKLYGKMAFDYRHYEAMEKVIRGKNSKNPIDPSYSRAIKKVIYGGEKIFSFSSCSKAVPLHTARREYANLKLEELKIKYEGFSKSITIAGRVADMYAFQELSEDMGHHRVKVLYRYLD